MVKALKAIAAALLCMSGAVSPREARVLAGLPDFNESQLMAFKRMEAWCVETGKPMRMQYFTRWMASNSEGMEDFTPWQ